MAVEDGATEIDVVINRTLVLTGQWEGKCMSLPKRETWFFPGRLDGEGLIRGSMVWKSYCSRLRVTRSEGGSRRKHGDCSSLSLIL